jgi:flavin reductase (DIM6/NTAB) family NADH-FMN oxidoreductase RutF
MEAKEIDVNDLLKEIDPISMMDTENYALLTAEKNGKANTMTVAWLQFGYLWNMPVATVYIRPQRYTKEFVDFAGRFSLTFFDYEEYSKALVYLGTNSGRDKPNKIEEAGLHLTYTDGLPTFEEGKIVVNCLVQYVQPITEEGFIYEEQNEAIYPDKDYSVMYIAKIESCYRIKE